MGLCVQQPYHVETFWKLFIQVHQLFPDFDIQNPIVGPYSICVLVCRYFSMSIQFIHFGNALLLQGFVLVTLVWCVFVKHIFLLVLYWFLLFVMRNIKSRNFTASCTYFSIDLVIFH